jgi:hypothetical protein
MPILIFLFFSTVIFLISSSPPAALLSPSRPFPAPVSPAGYPHSVRADLDDLAQIGAARAFKAFRLKLYFAAFSKPLEGGFFSGRPTAFFASRAEP